MRSAYWTELFWRATTLPVNTTRLSLPNRSILSESTVSGWPPPVPGGVAAGVHLLVPIPVSLVIPLVAAGLLSVEIFWSYRRFASLVKWLTLVLFLYVVSGLVAWAPTRVRPLEVLRYE